MRKKITILLAASILGLLLAQTGSAATLVANSDVDTAKMTVEQVEQIYLGKKTLWDSGQRVIPVMVNEDSAEARDFLDKVLKKTVAQYRAYWKRRLFSGGGTVPKTFRTTGEVIEFVSKTPGSIGVVQTGTKDPRVKVVEVAPQ